MLLQEFHRLGADTYLILPWMLEDEILFHIKDQRDALPKDLMGLIEETLSQNELAYLKLFRKCHNS